MRMHPSSPSPPRAGAGLHECARGVTRSPGHRGRASRRSTRDEGTAHPRSARNLAVIALVAAASGARGTFLTYKIDGRYNQTFLFTGDAVILAPDKAATDLVIGPPLA